MVGGAPEGALRDLASLSEEIADLDREAQLSRVFELARRRGALDEDVDPARWRELFETFTRNYLAIRRYRAPAYPGRVEWWRTETSVANLPATGWEELAAEGAGIHAIGDDHYSFLRPPGASVLARDLAGLLGR